MLVGNLNLDELQSVDGKVELVGHGVVKANPDLVKITYCIEVFDQVPAKAVSKVEKAISTFFTKLSSYSLDESAEAGDITIKRLDKDCDDDSCTLVTAFGRAYAVAGLDAKEGASVGAIPELFLVKRQVTVTISDFSLISKINQEAIASELNQITACEYSVSDTETYEEQAAHLAIEDIRHQASILSREFSIELSKPSFVSINRINDHCGVLYSAARTNHLSATDDNQEHYIDPALTMIYRPSPIKIEVVVRTEFLYQH